MENPDVCTPDKTCIVTTAIYDAEIISFPKNKEAEKTRM